MDCSSHNEQCDTWYMLQYIKAIDALYYQKNKNRCARKVENAIK